MRSTINHFYIPVLLLFFSCGNSSAEKSNETAPAANKIANASSNENNAGNGIVGEWEQQYTCFDQNGNYKLEPEEKKPSGTRTGFDWFRFNADGSCLRDKEIKFKSTYEIQEKGTTKELIIQNVHGYKIVELTDQELILGAEGAFMIFKKIA